MSAWDATSGAWTGAGVTAGDGTYAINLPAGSYNLYIQGGGQPASWYGGTSKATATDVDVTTTTTLDIALGKALLQGTVTVLASGDPVAGATVSPRGMPPAAPGRAPVYRRVTGTYAINLPAGSYNLYIQGGGQPASWYGGTSKATATDVDVTTTTTLDIALGPPAPPNQAPLCSGVSLSTAQDTAADAAPDCTDPDGDALSYAIVDPASHGTASVAGDQLHYVPEAGYTGDDAFTYQATDGELDSNTATVGVTVTPPGDPSLIAYWTMDETGGATAHDTGAAPANDAALSGSPTFGTGRIGNALSLDGSTQYGTVADEASLDITDAITIAAWVRPEKVGTQYLVKKATQGSVDGYELSLATSGKVFTRFNQASYTNDYRIDSLTSYPSDGNTWIHVAVTWDGSDIRLYYNGIQEGLPLTFAGPIAANSLGLGIGVQPDGASMLQGDLDDVRLYDRALSAGEIAALAETPNQAPLCSGVSLSTAQDTAADAAPDCTDPDGDALSYAIVDPASHGTASVAGDQLHYVPEAGYTGDDAFTYQATDGELDSNTATVGVTVTPPGDPSLIAYWTMDETGGATAHDTGAAPANDAALSGSPTFGTGRIGNALSLDGSTQYGTVADEASLDITDAITIAAWIEPAKLATQHLVQKGTMGAPNGYELSLASTGKVFFRLNNTAATRIDSTTLYPTDGHTWMHVAVTWDGSDMRIYVNGVAEGGTVAGPAAIATNSNPLVIGAVSDLTYKFQGAIDDVRIYNRALSAGEIAALAETPNHAP